MPPTPSNFGSLVAGVDPAYSTFLMMQYYPYMMSMMNSAAAAAGASGSGAVVSGGIPTPTNLSPTFAGSPMNSVFNPAMLGLSMMGLTGGTSGGAMSSAAGASSGTQSWCRRLWCWRSLVDSAGGVVVEW